MVFQPAWCPDQPSARRQARQLAERATLGTSSSPLVFDRSSGLVFDRSSGRFRIPTKRLQSLGRCCHTVWIGVVGVVPVVGAESCSR